jgi:hypothetical protein
VIQPSEEAGSVQLSVLSVLSVPVVVVELLLLLPEVEGVD